MNRVSRADRNCLELEGIREIRSDELSADERIECERTYIENVSDLSSEYNSLEWWANPASEKNEHISALYSDLCMYYELVKTLSSHSHSDLTIFIVCSVDIYEQLKGCSRFQQVHIQSLDNSLLKLFKGISRHISELLQIIFFLMKVIIKKTYTSCRLGCETRKKLEVGSNYYIIRTWLDGRFLRQGWTFRDPYFGRLPEYIHERGHDLLVLGSILSDYFKVIDTIKNTKGVLIIPEEYFLKYSDLFRLFVHCHCKKIKFKENVLFNGLDVTALYHKEIGRGFYSISFRSNILRYYMARTLANTVNFKNYIHTFENYAWEKMNVLGLREGMSGGVISGFQHAYISRNSFKYFPGTREQGIIPLPDKIITMGRVTKDKMMKFGNYKKEIFKIGCALRQEYLSSIKPFRRKRLNTVVVPLTMVKHESLSVMNFLYASGLAGSDTKVVVRCHPASPFSSFAQDLGFRLPDNFIISKGEALSDELANADMVLYTWTTVAVEALKMGLPVIYLDVLRPMYVDPLFECTALKRSIRKPEKLRSLMESIYSMDDETFYQEQEEAQEYLKEYFYPVTDDILQTAFIV